MIRRFDEDRPEMMDVATEASPALNRDLRNLASLNRRFGATRAVLGQLDHLLRSRTPLRIVDFGTGGGDIPRAIVCRARACGCPVSITAVDRQKPTLQIAEKFSEEFPEITFVPSDLLEYSEGSYDIVMCNLVLHHFDESDVIRLLRRWREMAKVAVLVTDLRRSRLAQVGIFAVTEMFYREPMTRHDARLSAERAFSFGEMHRLALAAGWSGFVHRRCPVFRQLLWLDKDARWR